MFGGFDILNHGDTPDMDELILPASAERLTKQLTALRSARRDRQAQGRKAPRPRRSLTPAQRAEVLTKTSRRCHICGGKIVGTEAWQADHVLSHSDGGAHSIDNYHSGSCPVQQLSVGLLVGRVSMGAEDRRLGTSADGKWIGARW